jgi:RNA polymerase sigma factor for flagellar operon FliA
MSSSIQDSHVLLYFWLRALSGDAIAYNFIHHYYLSWLKILVRKVMLIHKYPLSEHDDYLGFAYIGYSQAIRRFDISRGVKFESFAETYVRGAILKGLSPYIQDRQVRSNDRLSSIVDACDDGQDQFDFLIETVIGLAFGRFLELGIIEQDEVSHSCTQKTYDVEEASLSLMHLVSQLADHERDVVRLHYFEDHTFTDISRILNVSKGRVSQLHKRALEEIRHKLSIQDDKGA